MPPPTCPPATCRWWKSESCGRCSTRPSSAADRSGGRSRGAGPPRALIMDPPLLLLDEPISGLDPDSSDSIVRLLRSLHRDLELTVVMVTHDLDTLFELSTRIAVLAD